MRKYIDKAFGLAKSQTAKDTYILFVGNVASAFMGFIFTLVVARYLSVSEFGIFSAANNLIAIIISLSDLGISTGIVNFVAEAIGRGRRKEAEKYLKSAFVIKVIALSLFSFIVLVFGSFVSRNLLATSDRTIAWWTALISVAFLFDTFFPYVLQGEKKFLQSVILDWSISLPKAILPLAFVLAGGLSLNKVFLSFILALLVPGVIGFRLVGTRFLKERPDKKIYKDLVRFAGWIGVNRIISAVSGRLDIQMLAAIAGATATGFYSIPSKLTSFIIVLCSSFSAVLAPRFASFGNKKDEKIYLLKASLVLLPLVAGTILWIIIAKPFIVILFGQRYLPSVPVFRALAASFIPFILVVPPVAAIIYAMKKTIYIGLISFFQISAIFLLNYIFIPRYGLIGPTITFGIVNSVLAIYTWTIVIKYYWIDK